MKRFTQLPLFALAAALSMTACFDSSEQPASPAAPAQDGQKTSEAAPAPGSVTKTAAEIFSDGIQPQGVVLAPIPEAPAIAIPPPADDGKGLTISAARPKGSDLEPRTIAVTFSRPVAALAGAEVQAPPDVATIEPAVEGEWRWLGSTTAEFTPKKPLPRATDFKVTVKSGIKALDGSVLKEPMSFEFSTMRPRIYGIDPGSGETFVKTNPLISIVTNQPVTDLPQHMIFSVNGEKMPITFKRALLQAEYHRELQKLHGDKVDESEPVDPRGNMRYEFTPDAELPLDAKVCIDIDSQLAGVEGPRKVGTSRKSCFTTHGEQKIISIVGCGADDWDQKHCSNGPLFISLGTPADIESLKERVKVEPEVELYWDNATTGKPYSWMDTTYAWARVPGRFMPGETYKVTIDPGVKDEFGQEAAQGLEGTVTLADRDPFMHVDGETALLELNSDRKIPIYTVNAEKTEARLWKMTAEEFAAQANHPTWSSDPRPKVAADPVTVSIDLTGKKNLSHFAAVPLDAVLSPKADAAGEGAEGAAAEGAGDKAAESATPKSGFVMIEVDPLEKTKWSRPTVILAQVTDLAVHVHIGSQDGLAWVTSLSSGKPVAKAALRILKSDGTQLWKGETDDAGLAKIPGAVQLMPKEEKSNDDGMRWSGPKLLIVAAKDGDEGAVWTRWNEGISADDFNSVYYDWQGTSPNSRSIVFTDRGIYRPGDPLHIKGISRYFKNGVLYAPVENARVKIEINDPNGKTFFKSEKKLSAYGTFAESLTLPKDRPLGGYEIRTQVYQSGEWMTNWTNFRVEEYRAPQFKVDVVSPGENAIAGEHVQATVLSRYLFGGAMSGAQVSWSAERSRTSFTPPKNQGFSFGDNSWGWNDDSEEEGYSWSAQAGRGEGKADDLGAYQVDVGEGISQGGVPWSYTIEADVSDVNRQRVAGRTSIMVHPAEAYAGVRLAKDGFAEAGKETAIEVVAAAMDGSRPAGLPLSVKIIRRDWKNIRKKGVGGEWFTTSEPSDTEIQKCDLTSAAEPVSCKFTPDQPGSHLVQVTLKDSKGREQVSKLSFYTIGKGYISWRQNDDKHLELIADKTLYDVGEKAKILVKSPWPEAEALITVERSGVMFRRQMTMKGSATAVEIPIKDYLIPNAFVTVTLVRGRAKDADGNAVVTPGADAGRPDIRVGYVKISVEKKSKVLAVSVTPEKQEYRPRDKVSMTLNVANHAGEGVQSEVAVWAVDEGVLRMTNYSLPDLVAEIHSERGLSLHNSSSLIKLVIARVYGDKGASSGGGGGDDASGTGLRHNFVTTPLFTTVETDETGKATLDFDLPDNLTTYRIMALAVTKKDLFGSGESKVLVTKPLLAMPALPRFALLGDTVEAGVVLHRRTAGEASVTVKASARNLQLLEGAEKTVTLKQGAPQEIRFKFRPENQGTASLRFDVQSTEGDTDAVLQKFPVKLPVQREAVATAGSTSSENVEGVQVPPNVLPEMGGLEITYASTILGGLGASMKQLVEYPYGCAEQLSSRLIPFVVLRGLFGKYGVPYAAPENGGKQLLTAWLGEDSLKLQGSADPDEVIKKTIASIESLQMSSGGFRYWPSSRWPSADASIYATLALGRAAAVGYPVNKDILEKAKNFLTKEIATGKFKVCPYSYCPTVSRETRTFSLYALAKLGVPMASYYPTFFKERAKMSLAEKAMLGAAIAADGKDKGKMASTILDELGSLGQETPTEIHFADAESEASSYSWNSPVRTNALILEILADLNPNHPWLQKLSSWVMSTRRMDGTYRNTQEASFALMALGEVSSVTEREAPDFTARTFVGSKEVANKEFSGHDMKVERVLVPMADLVKQGGSEGQKIRMVRDGITGILRYGIRMNYYPQEMAKTPLERGLTVQRWFEPWQSKGQQSRGFNAGDLIRIKVRVASPMKRSFVVVAIPLPAGLEAIDTSLATTASLPSEGDESSSYFYSPFDHKELRDDRILAFADELPAGVHTLEFAARATTPGTFQLMPATAEMMYAPEVFGRSDGGSFSVILK